MAHEKNISKKPGSKYKEVIFKFLDPKECEVFFFGSGAGNKAAIFPEEVDILIEKIKQDS